MHLLRNLLFSVLLLTVVTPLDIVGSSISDRSVIRIIPLIPKQAAPTSPSKPPAKTVQPTAKATHPSWSSLKDDNRAKTIQINTQKRYHTIPRVDNNRVNVLILPPTSTAE